MTEMTLRCRIMTALIAKTDTALTVSAKKAITKAEENSGALNASVDGSYEFVIAETHIFLRPFSLLHPFYHNVFLLSIQLYRFKSFFRFLIKIH